MSATLTSYDLDGPPPMRIAAVAPVWERQQVRSAYMRSDEGAADVTGVEQEPEVRASRGGHLEERREARAVVAGREPQWHAVVAHGAVVAIINQARAAINRVPSPAIRPHRHIISRLPHAGDPHAVPQPLPGRRHPQPAAHRLRAGGAGRARDRPALVDGVTGRTISYGALVDGVRRLAAGLARRGLRKGDVVAIYAPNLPDTPSSFTASSAWAAFSPLSTRRIRRRR